MQKELLIQGQKKLLLPKDVIQKHLKKLLKITDIKKLRTSIEELKTLKPISPKTKKNVFEIKQFYWLDYIQQIQDAQTIERTHYYIERLIKSVTKVKTSKLNDINLNRWKEYDEIVTDSLWYEEARDKSGQHSAGYHGNFMPQIPQQMLLRYTKKDDWVLDTFSGMGTTMIECKKAGRNGIGIELNESVYKNSLDLIEIEPGLNDNTNIHLVNGNSLKVDYKKELKPFGIDKIQLAIMHPPYWDIIKFSDDEDDLSNAQNLDDFLQSMATLTKNVKSVLDKKRMLILVIGDKYDSGEWVPLAFETMQVVKNQGFKLKSIVVKNFNVTKAKLTNGALWRYRSIVGGFYIFKHEYIFIFENV